ncbi:SAF domain-containing protein [Rothia sp. ZJ1223]|uniref:flagella basal body P-ring formation protein FlgA n=1 Tax=Rothia sp. ZJ1223 TaxID=2811098 RepID=UPI00195C5369|nr:SAF domain-containing protein [Rothia sp. ZJ1223]
MPTAVPESSEGLSPRFQRPGLKDPRLLMGLLLIALSIVAVVSVVSLGNKTEPFYVATRDMAVGEEVKASDFALADVRLAEAGQHYIPQEKTIAEGSVVTSRITSGQLVPATALAQELTDGRRTASITIDSAYASTLTPGKHVDIWIATKAQGTTTTYNDPEVVMEAAEVSTISNEESLIGGTGKSAVQLLVAEESLSAILKAINNEDKINLVPSDYKNQG